MIDVDASRCGRQAERGTKKYDILRAAETCFAAEGYHGTSLRDIAAAANVKVTLLQYHFVTKGALYFAVFEDRQYVNEERLRLLRLAEGVSGVNALELIVSAFVDPVLDLHDDPLTLPFARLVLREAADPSSQGRPIMSTFFDPMAQQFVAALRAAMPDRAAGFHEWAYLFAVGALTQSAFDVRLQSIAVSGQLADKRASLKAFLFGALAGG